MASYIPAKMALFAAWLLNFKNIADAEDVALGLSGGDVTAITGTNTAFQAAYALATAPETRTSPNIAALNVARANAEYIVRPYAVRISLDRTIADALKVSLGVTVRSAVPTPVPAPVDAPTLAITGAIPGQVTIGVRVPGASGKAKPDGCIGCEVWAVAGVAPAVDPAQTAFRNIATKSPFNFSVPEGDKGKDITVFARYTTRSGPGGIAQQGPWSLPLNFVGM